MSTVDIVINVDTRITKFIVVDTVDMVDSMVTMCTVDTVYYVDIMFYVVTFIMEIRSALSVNVCIEQIV